MKCLWICLLAPLALASPIPISELEEAVDVLLTTVEAHGKKIKNLENVLYNVGDVLEKQAFLLSQLEEIVEDKKDQGYSDDVGQEEVKDDQVQEQVLSEELEKIRGLKSKTEVDPEEIYETESLQEPEEVVEEEVQELQEPTAEEKLTSDLESESSVEE
ncbi:X-linked retinitis pigmentosa GTPase regulator-interacting protein 1-like [Ostrea edulis]|uniref:X-linked retinitis pigmentosa GTPase regulator-interacting protein 1-like n=1 Tax=Ostrea edulis TaxID=37623 RepID=UPI0024AF46C5|nr:X-linked retinitis pigmentosa GTPase regulator-interacting protein 1-like [Ostrea edulis]